MKFTIFFLSTWLILSCTTEKPVLVETIQFSTLGDIGTFVQVFARFENGQAMNIAVVSAPDRYFDVDTTKKNGFEKLLVDVKNSSLFGDSMSNTKHKFDGGCMHPGYTNLIYCGPNSIKGIEFACGEEIKNIAAKNLFQNIISFHQSILIPKKRSSNPKLDSIINLLRKPQK